MDSMDTHQHCNWSSERAAALPPHLRTEVRLFLEVGREKVISHQAFRLFDKDGDGLITLKELMTLMKSVGGCLTEVEGRSLLEEADQVICFLAFNLLGYVWPRDQDGNHGVDYQEFTRLWSIIRGPLEGEAGVRKEFERLDLDNSGYITKDELLSVLSESGNFLGDPLLVKEASGTLEALDLDQDGRVSYPEFLLAWKFRK